MLAAPISSPNLMQGTLTQLIGHAEDVPGKYVTTLQDVISFTQSLVGSGPLAEALAELKTQIDAIAEATGANPGTVGQITQRLNDIRDQLIAAAGYDGSLDRRLAVMQRVTDLRTKYRPTFVEFRPQAPFAPRQKTFNVQFPQIIASLEQGDVLIPAQTVTFAAPVGNPVTETKTLRYPGTYNGALDISNFPGPRLGYQYVTINSVRREDNNLLLVKGVDYDVKPNTGLIYSIKNVPDFNVIVNYTGWTHRYDILYGPASGNNQGYGMVQGTNRIVDPEEYIPAVPAGFFEIWRVYIYMNADGTPRADILPRYRYRGRALVARPGEYADILEYCRSCLPRVFARLRRGLPLKLVGVGTSLTAQGGGSGGNQTVPNADRDRLRGPAGFYQVTTSPELVGRMPDDTAAAIPRFNGPLGPGEHVHLGWNWYLKTAIENAFGVRVDYRNWGVPGSTSDATMTNGIMNGLYPARINAVLADVKDALVVVEFGTNEPNSPFLYSNLVAMIGYIMNAGAAGVIVVPPPQVGYPGGYDAFSQAAIGNGGMLVAHAQCVNAAKFTGSAFIDTIRLSGNYPAVIDLGTPPQVTKYPVDPEIVPGLDLDLFHRGCDGLSEMNRSNMNLLNHGGPEEFKHLGYSLADIFQVSEAYARPTNAPVLPDTFDPATGAFSRTSGSNLIEKGLPIPAGGDADLVVTFPVPFPNRCFRARPTLDPGSIGVNVTYTATVTNVTRFGCTIQRRGIGSGGPGPAYVGGWLDALGD